MRIKMKTKEWATIIILMIVIAAIVAYFTGAITGNVVKVSTSTGKKAPEVYTKDEVDKLIASKTSNSEVLNILNHCNPQGIGRIFSSTWNIKNVIDTNGDNVATGQEICQYFNKTCFFTEDVNFNVVAGTRSLVEVAQTPKGCFGGTSFDDYTDNSKGMIAFCC